ncbi:hypothetical protein NQ315_003327 [Exocentrus adspersus]|uniref:Uncharacterized protein n=1 Tax=Exocentrus adspersus TaxID=1586481 RepID=A0AAV8VC82_9CUCU|nr:hypothetical protein NQ315_003327 [Exocentrus adspersus]
MIERFVELEEPLRSMIALLDIVLPQLTFDEWPLVKDLKNILEPFEDATRVMRRLLDVCQEILKTDLTRTATAVVRKLQHGLRNRLGNLEYSNTLAATTFLDPRYKTLPFKNSDAVERARKKLYHGFG